jgi:hypothetical protein
MKERSREHCKTFRCVIHNHCNTERSRVEIEERSREHFTFFRCVIHHQCNTERSGVERSGGTGKEERSREHCTMFRCIIHHQCNTERSGVEWNGAGERGKKRGPVNILQCSGALFIISVTRSGAERSGDGRKVLGTLENIQVRYP